MSRGRKRVGLVGSTETGKSTVLKKMLQAMHDPLMQGLIIYDTNRQKSWLHLPEITLDQWKAMLRGQYRIHDPDYRAFYEIAKNKRGTGWKGVIAHEDADDVFGPQKEEDVFSILIGLRHMDTDFIPVTHSIADTPKYIIRHLNEMILFKTGDNWKDVRDRFRSENVEQVRLAFERVNSSENPHAFERIILQKTGTL